MRWDSNPTIPPGFAIHPPLQGFQLGYSEPVCQPLHLNNLSQFIAVPCEQSQKLVLSTRIELVFHPYQGCVMPLYYESWLVRPPGIEPGLTA